jgi:phospholipid-binding lipoprotein MlaA
MSRFRLTCLMVLLLMTVAGTDLVRAAESFDPGSDPFAEEDAQLKIADPIESVNRGVFWINDKLYFYLFKPIARAYRVVPQPARTSVSHFFTNLGFPIRFVSHLLQFKFSNATIEFDRFLINSTAGLAGLFDPASGIPDFKLPDPDEDLGQSLGYYGAGNGFYLVLPVFGPSSLRDGIGTVGEVCLDPWTYIDFSWLERGGVKGFDITNRLSLDKDTYEQIKQDAIDPYLFIRNAYVQRRQAQIAK